jgi:hypothetical protein
MSMQVNQSGSPFVSLAFSCSMTSIICTTPADAFSIRSDGVMEQWSDGNFELFWNADKLQHSKTPVLQACLSGGGPESPQKLSLSHDNNAP